jgi:hypothetical protein
MKEGFVLGFSNRTFADFMKNYDVDIYNEKFNLASGSKANRLRSFVRQSSEVQVANVLYALLKEKQLNSSGTWSEGQHSLSMSYMAIVDKLRKHSIEGTESSSCFIPYSIRNGLNQNSNGFGIIEFRNLFHYTYNTIFSKGLLEEYLAIECEEHNAGIKVDVSHHLMMTLRKDKLWPVQDKYHKYSEEDIFDLIEFLFTKVSSPQYGPSESFYCNYCGEEHSLKFHREDGIQEYLKEMNAILALYEKPHELTQEGMVVIKPEHGLDNIFNAEVPTQEERIIDKVNSAVSRFRRHGSSIEDRKHAVRDLADILESVRGDVKKLLSKKDELTLFDIANNFGIRHMNNKQQDNYDPVWLSWMFYFYLSTIHTVLRRIEARKKSQ